MVPIEQIDLIAPEPFTPPPDFNLLVRLLEEATSLTVVSEFLKKRHLTHSAGSWEEMKDKRLAPALKSGGITLDELNALLSEVEEFGGAHTFLYHCDKSVAREIIDEDSVKSIAARNGLKERIGLGRILDQPATPTLAAIRFERDSRGASLVFKVVEKRFVHTFLQDKTDGNRYSMEWEITEARAVSVVRLFEFGLLEVRIASHNSKKYDDDIRRIMEVVKAFVPFQTFSDFPLRNAKIELWTNSKKYADTICFSNSCFRGRDGATLSAASGKEEGDIAANPAMSDALASYIKKGNAYCESSNLYWLPQKDALPSAKIHVILPDLRNEFAVTASCSKADYEHVFDQIRALSN